MTTMEELYRLWGGKPKCDELDAFEQWAASYNASETEYQAYEDAWAKDDAFEPLDEAQKVSALNYYYCEECPPCSPSGTGGEDGTSTSVAIASDDDDGCWSPIYGGFQRETTRVGFYLVLSLVPDDVVTAQSIGSSDALLLFRNVQIPAGAIINRAFVRLEPETTNAHLHLCITGSGDQIDIPENGGTSHIDALNKTANSVQWPIEDVSYNDREKADTPDIRCVIQEIIDTEWDATYPRSGTWVSGNALYLFIRTCAYEYDEHTIWTESGSNNITYTDENSTPYSYSPVLYIWYSSAFDEAGSDGVALGGTATVGHLLNETGLGGIALGGEAEWTMTIKVFTETMEGGLSVGGVAREDRLLFPATSGGVSVGGGAHVFGSETIPVGGGVALGGKARVPHWRMAVVVPAGAVEADLANFLLTLTTLIPSEHLGDSVLKATDQSGNPVACDVISYVSGVARLALKVNLTADSDNIFYLVYGD